MTDAERFQYLVEEMDIHEINNIRNLKMDGASKSIGTYIDKLAHQAKMDRQRQLKDEYKSR